MRRGRDWRPETLPDCQIRGGPSAALRRAPSLWSGIPPRVAAGEGRARLACRDPVALKASRARAGGTVSAAAASPLLQNRRDGRGDRIPPFGFAGELTHAPLRQSVVLRLSIVLGRAPVRFDEAVELHSMQGWIKRALLDPQDGS